MFCIYGFSFQEDWKLWRPDKENPPPLSLELAKKLLIELGDQFCEMVQQEFEALEAYEKIQDHYHDIAWKHIVVGVREMCDVCVTTLFNYHWTCHNCGFVVCISCYKTRQTSDPKVLRPSCASFLFSINWWSSHNLMFVL